MGYHRAGFEVVGVDIKPQKHYPFEFHQADAMTYPLDGFDVIHASPPCQDHVRAPGPAAKHGTGWMLNATRVRLMDWARWDRKNRHWIIENVPGAPLRADYKLCGCLFGLPKLKRERRFETSWRAFDLRSPCNHKERPVSVTGHGTPTMTWKYYGTVSLQEVRQIMGIDWMSRYELSQAIPPTYTEFIGKQLIKLLRFPSN